MVRIAVETIVWSSAPRNMPIIRPVMMVRIWRWVYWPDSAGGTLASETDDIALHSIGCPRQPIILTPGTSAV